MSNKPNQLAETTAPETLMAALRQWQDQQLLDSSLLEQVHVQLHTVSSAASTAGAEELRCAASVLDDLLQIAECMAGDETQPEDSVTDILQFVANELSVVEAQANGENEDVSRLDDISRRAWEHWRDSLVLVADEPVVAETEPVDDAGPMSGQASDQIDLLLSVLDTGEAATGADVTEDQPVGTPALAQPSAEQEWFADTDGQPCELPVPPQSLSQGEALETDVELREAFLDDAHRCLASMERVVLDTDSFGSDTERSQAFCRELHTLKGASATAGLKTLARYLHQFEEWLGQNDENLDDGVLLQAIDAVRHLMNALEPNIDNAAEPSADGNTAAPVSKSTTVHAVTEPTVRVRAAQLDRLMDMMAELVSLRNRRDMEVEQVAELQRELVRCSGRLRQIHDEQGLDSGMVSLEGNSESQGGNAIDEIARDISSVSRVLSNKLQPVADGNVALSQFIRGFRQELMQLRRLPIAGLFQRLKRAVHDAARAEQKQVQVVLHGEECGLEQAVQDRLFEPLLHLVRNSVSHGIEAAETRAANNKPARGAVTLQARASASQLVITVSDDGGGLDYDALRRRGFERGLLSPGSDPSRKQLARLIFHPGFSTRDSASQVSGRGVGMDVVATAIDRMHGRIEMDSTPGEGTDIRVSIPLTTGIEHVMVVRAGSQLFAMPMLSVVAANGQLQGHDNDAGFISLAAALGVSTNDTATSSTQSTVMLEGHTGVRVDEILGPDEVVVRPLPATLRRHPLFNGVVLLGSGETVLLLNVDRAQQWCRRFADQDAPVSRERSTRELAADRGESHRRALVVDDSISARKSLARILRRQEYEVVEAGDGIEALSCLRHDDFDLITTDIDMPRMDGLELLGELSQSNGVTTSVIVVSSRPREEVWDRASQNGALAYFTKPASEESLVSLINQLDELKENQLTSGDTHE